MGKISSGFLMSEYIEFLFKDLAQKWLKTLTGFEKRDYFSIFHFVVIVNGMSSWLNLVLELANNYKLSSPTPLFSDDKTEAPNG